MIHNKFIKSICICLLLALFALAKSGFSQQNDAFRTVIVKFVPNTVQMPANEINANIDNVRFTSPLVESILRTNDAQEVAKTFPNFKLSDTLGVSIHGNEVKLANMSHVYSVIFPEQSNLERIIQNLQELRSHIVYAHLDGIAVPAQVDPLSPPNDSYYGNQWNLDNASDTDIDAPRAWTLSTGSSSTILGIIDYGVDQNHMDLIGKVTGDTEISNHGTHVAGIAAANTNNSEGIAGIDWKAEIHDQQIATANDDNDIYNTIMDAINNGTHVINNSWRLIDGNENARYSATVREAFANAYKMGVVATAAMGNQDAETTQYPAGFGQGIIAVGASNSNGDRYSFSNYGAHIDVAAPGVGIWSSVSGDLYDNYTGTSMATPHVTGIGGLMRSINTGLYNDDYEQIIRLGAKDLNELSNPGWDKYMGEGVVSAFNALNRLKEYQTDHLTSNGGNTYSSTGTYTMTLIGVNGLADANYVVKRYDVRKDINYSEKDEVAVWGRGMASTGYSAANPNYGLNWTQPVSGTVTSNSATLQTFVYEVWSITGAYLGWYPTWSCPEKVDRLPR